MGSGNEIAVVEYYFSSCNARLSGVTLTLLYKQKNDSNVEQVPDQLPKPPSKYPLRTTVYAAFVAYASSRDEDNNGRFSSTNEQLFSTPISQPPSAMKFKKLPLLPSKVDFPILASGALPDLSKQGCVLGKAAGLVLLLQCAVWIA